ncbi:MAG: hypothetical protein KF767_06940 [Bdellovibrionaceae bacterium]|nr:hypothetical protein [Pseudobdellovibrionaceae bacterium]
MNAELSSIDQTIRAGETRRARQALMAIRWKSLPRSELVHFANLCRRAQIPAQAARALFPLVRHESPTDAPATPAELAEYAVALQRLGANREALEILRGLPEATRKSIPQWGLYVSFCLVSQWKYDEALGVLQSSLSQADLDPYLRQIILINDFAARIAVGDIANLAGPLQEFANELATQGARRLQANALELLSQVHLLSGELKAGEAQLNAAADLHADEKAWDQLYIRKWRGILRALKDRDAGELLHLRSEVEGTGHFESLRDIDFHLLRTRFDEERFRYLYFGTPHRSYRRRLHEFGAPRTAEAWAQIPGSTAKLTDFDPMIDVPDLGSLPHRTLQLFLRDFYHPFRVAEIFGLLHPEEFFDPDHSPNRVHQSLHATRAWLTKHQFNFRIDARGTRFRLNWGDHYRLRVREPVLPVTEMQIYQYRMELAAPGPEHYWSRQETQELLGCAKSVATRFLDPTLNPLILEKRGGGPQTRYRVRPYSDLGANIAPT